MNRKKLPLRFFTETKIGIRNLFRNTEQPGRALYAKGRYLTEIIEKDLPEHYIRETIFHVVVYPTMELLHFYGVG